MPIEFDPNTYTFYETPYVSQGSEPPPPPPEPTQETAGYAEPSCSEEPPPPEGCSEVGRVLDQVV